MKANQTDQSFRNDLANLTCKSEVVLMCGIELPAERQNQREGLKWLGICFCLCYTFKFWRYDGVMRV